MIELQYAALALVAVSGTAVVLTYEPRRQVITSGVFGTGLAILFLAFQAPDVALSQVAVGSVALPAFALLTLAKIARVDRDEEERD